MVFIAKACLQRVSYLLHLCPCNLCSFAANEIINRTVARLASDVPPEIRGFDREADMVGNLTAIDDDLKYSGRVAGRYPTIQYR